jgi:uncharacterized cupin superfamily protein
MNSQQILFEHKPAPGKLEVLGVYDWPIRSNKVAKFPLTYAKTEVCYLLRGRAIVTPEGQAPIEFQRGDLITFPAGLQCTREILEDIEKHYTFE